MISVFEWYAGLPRWQQVVCWSIWHGLTFAIVFGVLSRELSGMAWGLFVGLIGGPLIYHFVHRRGRPQRSAEVLEDPTFQMVDRRHLKRISILLPVMAGAGFLISLLAFGTGLYGIPVGGLVAAIVLLVLWRFGGPGDPRWRDRAYDRTD